MASSLLLVDALISETLYPPYADKHGASAATEGLAKIKAQMDHEYSSGNGSLMRILPVGLAYWKSEEKARTYARRSSMTTHPNEMCQEACEVWTGAIVRTMQAACAAESDVDLMPFSKLDLLHYIASFPYRNQKLREALAAPGPDISSSSSKSERDLRLEEHYRTHHPVLKLLADREKLRGRRTGEELNLPSEKELSSSGYVLHTIVAALYCFLASSTFEEGAILAANLGNDSDTVGAVYAGLAGCWYGGNELEYFGEDGGETRFWNSRVNEWKKDLVMKNLIEEVSEQLVKFDVEWV
ncbi:hypothetical protein VKT23_014566 [Stygiomarasmius scandens]|uniref:ADP-ribosylhydrolase ARH3 n=1 Tax=Marasmiellus scandens TaxID=2682957 RepID=A0ABR1J313_9AGAR